MGIRTQKEGKKSKAVFDEYISVEEFKYRQSVWAEYYTKVHTTRAYERFVEQKDAASKGNSARVLALSKEAREAIAEEKLELMKPLFPDPDLERRYKRLGVQEWDIEEDIVSAAQEIFG